MVKAFSLKNLVKKYPGFTLGPINLELDSGKVLGLVGPNGAGKTTTLHCMVGLVKPEAGEITICGNYINKKEYCWKFDIGYIGDENPLFEWWSVHQNLRFFSQFYPNWSNDYAKQLAERFEIPLDKKVRDLSTGNRMKVALISALAHKPKLLLLDEPTSGLDPIVRVEALNVLRNVMAEDDQSIVYSTHILTDLSRIADEIAFLRNGKIIHRARIDILTEQWRLISFISGNEVNTIDSAISYKREGNEHWVVSQNYEKSINQIRTLGVENIRVNRLSIEEIAVHILKGGENNVEITES
jgi:ABC-2 type transport system ATP-binding protein